jgi:3',5'-nucleoside bisphosphate phosphatase
MELIMRRIKCFSIFLLLTISVSISFGQTRTEFRLPDILGYKTLKCDFHMHTVFSDGQVWPSVRAEEAWRNGIDAIAITDHLEYTPFKEDMNIRYNRSFEIAKGTGDLLNIIVIRGAEITRSMPPGHINAIFLTDVEKIVKDDWKESIKAAKEQGAFIFYNHPGWTAQQPDGIPRWYPEHEELYKNGMLNGVEVVNMGNYYPLVQKWYKEKKLTLMCNSDVHEPAGTGYETYKKERKSFTIVFAKERAPEAIKDALNNQRTVAYWNNHLAGDAKYLNEIFKNSLSYDKTQIEFIGKERKYIQITNNSDISYELTAVKIPENIEVPEKITLEAGKTTLFSVKSKVEDIDQAKEITVSYVVENLYSEPWKGMPVDLKFNVKFLSIKKN